MATLRQIMINKVAFKVSERDYEAWRYEQGDPIPEAKAKAEAMGFKYAVRPVDDTNINEMVEGALTPLTRGWYMDMSDEAYKRMLRAIRKAARERVERLIDAYKV